MVQRLNLLFPPEPRRNRASAADDHGPHLNPCMVEQSHGSLCRTRLLPLSTPPAQAVNTSTATKVASAFFMVVPSLGDEADDGDDEKTQAGVPGSQAGDRHTPASQVARVGEMQRDV